MEGASDPGLSRTDARKEVGERTSLEPEKVTRAVDQLVTRGFVSRRSDPGPAPRDSPLAARAGRSSRRANNSAASSRRSSSMPCSLRRGGSSIGCSTSLSAALPSCSMTDSHGGRSSANAISRMTARPPESAAGDRRRGIERTLRAPDERALAGCEVDLGNRIAPRGPARRAAEHLHVVTRHDPIQVTFAYDSAKLL